MFVFALATLLSAVALSEDAEPSGSRHGPLVEPALSVEELLAIPDYPIHWTPPDLAQPIIYRGEQLQPIADFSFQDSSALARLGRLRSLSLFTFMQSGQKRLFLGVSDDGLLGLHFNADSDAPDEEFLEVVRMPYLDEVESDSDDGGED